MMEFNSGDERSSLMITDIEASSMSSDDPKPAFDAEYDYLLFELDAERRRANAFEIETNYLKREICKLRIQNRLLRQILGFFLKTFRNHKMREQITPEDK